MTVSRTPSLIPIALVAALAPAAGVRSEPPSAVAKPARAPHAQSTRLVFTASVAEGQTQIYSIEPSGHGAAQLTFGSESAFDPIASPDGKRIAFERGGSLLVMQPNGKHQRLIAARGIQPAWTPDSRRIAYVSAAQNAPGIRIVGVDGRSDRMLVAGAGVNAPAWSPDGRSLAFGRSGSLVVLRAGVQRTVFKRPNTGIGRIVWSADGRWLAFDYTAPLFGFAVVRANGRNLRELHGVRPGTAAWSPNRPRLAYVGDAGNPLRPSFTLLTPANGRIRTLAAAPAFVNSLVWSPAGGALAFSGGAYLSEDISAVSELGVIPLAGRPRYLDRGLLYPLPASVVWTTSPAGVHYRPPAPIGPRPGQDELQLREPVDELAADGDQVAFRSCGTIGVWRPGNAKVVSAQVDRPLCGESNISFYNLVLAGDRLGWGVLQGGIQQSNTLVIEAVGDQAWRAVLAAHSQLAGDPRGTERTGELRGAGDLLVFSTWAYCNEVEPALCPNVPFPQATAIASQTLWRVRASSWSGACPGVRSDQTGGHCQQLRTEPGPLRPLDVDAGRIVVGGDNATLVLDGDGRQLLSLPVSTRAAQLAGADLAVVLPGELRDYNALSGALLHVWPLPDVSVGGVCGVPSWTCGTPRLRLEGAARGIVAYVLDGKLHLLHLHDGADTFVTDATAAQLDDSGLFYAYRTTGTWPGRIRFVPFDQLPVR